MSDRIVVMSAGEVQQEGAPEEVYNTPANEFVARFLGAANIFEARVTGGDGDAVELDTAAFGRLSVPRGRAPRLGEAGAAKLVVRAEKLALSDAASVPPGAVGAAATVAAVDYQGQLARYFLRIGDLQAQAIQMIDGRPFPEGAEVAVSLRPEDCTALPDERLAEENGPGAA